MKILIIDDHALFRDGLSHVLMKLDDHVSVLEASSCDSALQQISYNIDIDLVLLDLNMPGTDGFEVLEKIAERYPAAPVVILSASTSHSDIQRSLDAGALGFIGKDITSAVMLNALRLILSGGIYIPPNMKKADSENDMVSDLTPRQMQVLQMLFEGHSNKVIADKLSLAEATIKMHISSIFKCLEVTNRTQAAIKAGEMELFAK